MILTSSGQQQSAFLEIRFPVILVWLILVTIFINRAGETIGFSIDELEGRSFYKQVHPEDLAVFSACHRAREYSHVYRICPI